jgi:serine/threonine protein phosphatase PrpC
MTTSSIEEQQPLDLSSLRCAAGTDVGMRRDENQDAFGIIKKEGFHAYFVADGMGGVRGGAVASRTAVAGLEELFKAQAELPSVDAIASIAQTINQRIFEKGGADPALAGMGTTLVGLLFSSNAAYCLNIGDSRAYRVRAGSIIQLSEDHTLVRELVCSGAITPEQAEHHPVAHMLTRSLGPLEEIQVEITRLDAPQLGDIYVLCSDGLYNFVDSHEIVDVVRQNPLDDASQILINLANQRGGSDNITVVIVAIGDTSSKKRSAQYRQARDVAAQNLHEGTSSDERVRGEQVEEKPADRVASDTANLTGEEAVTAGGRPAGKTQFIEPPPVEEPPELDRVEAHRQRKRPGYHKPKGGVPVPLLVVAALVFGMVVGGLARRFIHPLNLSDVALLSGKGRNEEVASSRNGVGKTTTSSERSSPSNQRDNERQAILSTSNPEKDKLVRDAFESSIRKLESQIAALGKPSSTNSQEDVVAAKKKADDIQTSLVSIEEQIGAASRKLQQWYARQKRLETQDALKLAAEVGASAESVQKKKASFEAATYDLIRTLDDVEQHHPNDEAKREQLATLKERRIQLLRELQEEVRDTVDTVLAETNKHVEDLKIQRQLLTLQLETVKQDLEYAKALAEPDRDRRLAMRKRLEQNLESLRSSLVDLERLMSGGNGVDDRSGGDVLGEAGQR